ncbi:MAG: hypothetical protein ACYCV7_17220, partial [Acidimicrobiales bacterium]
MTLSVRRPVTLTNIEVPILRPDLISRMAPVTLDALECMIVHELGPEPQTLSNPHEADSVLAGEPVHVVLADAEVPGQPLCVRQLRQLRRIFPHSHWRRIDRSNQAQLLAPPGWLRHHQWWRSGGE